MLVIIHKRLVLGKLSRFYICGKATAELHLYKHRSFSRTSIRCLINRTLIMGILFAGGTLIGTLIIRNGIYSSNVGKHINVNMFVFIEDVRCIVNH